MVVERCLHWIVVLGLVVARTSSAQVETVENFTARVTAALAEEDPEAAKLFEEANAARDGQELEKAEDLYAAVLERRPGFIHAKRRLSSVVLALGRRDEALKLVREAYAAEKSLENRVALLTCLVTSEGESPPSRAEIQEAHRQAQSLLIDAGRSRELDPTYMLNVCQAALLADDLGLLRNGVAHLRRTVPEEPGGYYYAWIVAMSDGDLDRAQAAIAEGRRRGLPPEILASMRAGTDEATPWTRRYLPLAKTVGIVWAIVLVVLFASGALLSALTLRAARRIPNRPSGESTGLDAGLRRAYRIVLWSSCAFYYVSIPLVLLAVVGVGAGAIYGFLAVGHIPIKLALLIVAGVVVTVWAGVRSLWIGGTSEDPGERLDLEAHPRLRAVLDDVAERIGTRPVDNVYLTPGTELAVMERGGLRTQLQGSSERCLILGVGVLEGMRLGPFQAILGHEYGHFTNKDTAGGGFALAVRRSLLTMAMRLAQGGAAGWYNPAWLFLRGFHNVFLRISQGASRLQEVLADRWAAFSYGAAAFEEGLRHVIARSVRFDALSNVSIREVVEQEKALVNLYAYRPEASLDEAELERAIESAIDAEPSPFDSHPAPRDRFAWVHALPSDAEPGPHANDEVWSVFEDREALELRMTDLVRQNVRENHGVEIPA